MEGEAGTGATGTGTTGEGASSAQATGATGTAATSPTFTQADLDRVVSERLARERGKFADYDALKAKADLHDAAEAANQTELQKATARADAAEKKATESVAKLQASTVRAAVVAAAAKAGAVDGDTVATLIDMSQVTVGADGSVTNATELVAALLTAKPFLKATEAATGSAGTGFDGGARTQTAGLTAAKLRSMTPQQVAALDPRVVQAAMAAK